MKTFDSQSEIARLVQRKRQVEQDVMKSLMLEYPDMSPTQAYLEATRIITEWDMP